MDWAATRNSLPPVHPRARGEHVGVDVLTRGNFGSSPRTRGTSGEFGEADAGDRFIPAHAGNMVLASSSWQQYSVHPRARGEHNLGTTACKYNPGSSPRTRGTYAGGQAGGGIRRFIPAHAGNISASVKSSTTCAVHPRARGEHMQPMPASDRHAGSSPRTRGTCDRRHCRQCRVRFIPAHAGNMKAAPPTAITTAVHPRARGEH